VHLLEQGGMTPHRSLPPRSRDKKHHCRIRRLPLLLPGDPHPHPHPHRRRCRPGSGCACVGKRAASRYIILGVGTASSASPGRTKAGSLSRLRNNPPPPRHLRPRLLSSVGPLRRSSSSSFAPVVVIFSPSPSSSISARKKNPRRRPRRPARSRRTRRPPPSTPPRNEIPSTRPPRDALAEISRPDPPLHDVPLRTTPPPPRPGWEHPARPPRIEAGIARRVARP
jgi:hypothetical protein